MVRFLIKATDHWMDSVPPNIRNQWPDNKKEAFARRIQRGDPVAVKGEGHIWGTQEGLPDWVQADVTDMDLVTAESYLEAIYDIPDAEGNALKLYRRRFRLKKQWMDNIVNNLNGAISVTTAQIQQQILDKI